MSTKKLTLRNEAATRSSDQIMVLSAKQINDYIYPDRIILANNKYLLLLDTDGDGNGYLTRDANNNIILANLRNSAWLSFTIALASGNQRSLVFREYGTTNTVQLLSGYEFSIRTSNDNINIVPAADLLLYPVGDIFVTTYERHIQIPARLTGNPANQPTEVDFFTTAGLQFPTTGAKYSFFQWELGNDWDGTDIYIEVDWFADSGAMSGTDTVQWIVQYACVAEGEVHGAALYNTLTLTNSDDNAQYKSIHSRGTMPYNDVNQPLTKQDHIYFKVTRNTAVANDFGGSATVTAFEIIYNSNQIPRGN